MSGEVPPPDFQRTVVVEGLTAADRLPVPASCRPEDHEPDRILIAEKGGAIKVYNGSANAETPLITLPVPTANCARRGMNGIEVDPDFNANGYIYVSYHQG